MTNQQLISDLFSFIDNSPSMFHTAESIAKTLEENDFTYLPNATSWDLNKGNKYYTSTNNSAIIAFEICSTNIEQTGFRIVGTHTDVPGFRIKSNPQMQTESYIKLNTEVYGGPILATWFDRPLSCAGRVALKSDNILRPERRLVNIEEPIMVIPSLAIHMNRNVNDGYKFNPQKETLPILTYCDDTIKEDMLLQIIADKLQVNKDDILDADMFLYPTEKSCSIGVDKKFVSAPRLDDLSMTFGGLHALITSEGKAGVNVLVCYDNEEVGSCSKQGANSPFLLHTLERITSLLNKTREEYLVSLRNSFIISADVAHLHHPNFPEKSDPTNKVLPGKGPAIKVNSNCKYTTDSDSFAVFANLCIQNGIPYQVFFNRSDQPGGSTIGPITSSQLGIRSVDIGTPLLAMHSARELMAQDDFIHTCDAMRAFYNLD
ncbi:MAG: M18 family aminopeptidase [Epulopiscium sp. Nele67-Bin004]|nr:MAG: M18 family aminopeptidase [Epulopiscium sp. Nele67-Bin004]